MIAVGTRIAGDVDRLCLAPPHVAPQLEVHHDVREGDVGDGTLVAVLYAQPSVGGSDDAVVNQHIVDVVHVLTTNLDGTRAAGQGAVGHHDVVAGSVLGIFAAVLQADTVVARGDMAIGYAHVLRMVEVDAVAIAYLQVVQQVDAVDECHVAAHEVHCPVGSLIDGDIADEQVVAGDERQHVGSRVKGWIGQRFQFIGVVQLHAHKLDTVAVDSAATGDAQVAGTFGPDPHHALATILAEGAQRVEALIGIAVQLHIALQLQGATKEGMLARQQHPSAAFRRTFVDGLLQGGGIIGLTVAFGSEVQHVVNTLGSCRQGHYQQKEN